MQSIKKNKVKVKLNLKMFLKVKKIIYFNKNIKKKKNILGNNYLRSVFLFLI